MRPKFLNPNNITFGTVPPPDSLIGRSIDSLSIPEIMTGVGGYMTANPDDSVVLVNPQLPSNSYTLYAAVKMGELKEVITGIDYRLSTSGYARFVLSHNTSANKFSVYIQDRDNNLCGASLDNDYAVGQTLIVAAALTKDVQISVRSSVGNVVSTNFPGGNASVANRIANQNSDSKFPFFAVYSGAHSDSEMDAVVNGGKLPSNPAYVYCPTIQGTLYGSVVKSTAGACTITDNSPATFWTVDGTNNREFGETYYDTTSGLTYTKTRGGVYNGNDATNFTSGATVNPENESYSVVTSFRYDGAPGSAFALYSSRVSGCGIDIIITSASVLQFQARLSGTNSLYSADYNAGLQVGETYRVVGAWDHLTSGCELTLNDFQIRTSSVGSGIGTTTSRNIATTNSGRVSMNYFARIKRYITSAEALNINSTGFFNATGADQVVNPSITGLTSGTSIPNYGYLDGSLSLSDGSPASYWSEWWMPNSKVINGSLGSFSLPMIMSMPGGYLTEDASDDSVSLPLPEIPLGSGVTVLLAFKFDQKVFANGCHIRFSPTGYFRFLFRSDTSGNFIIAGASDTTSAIKTIIGSSYSPGDTVIVAASFDTSFNISVRSTLGNYVAAPSASTLTGTPTIIAVSGSWKLPVMVAYTRVFTDAEMDAIIAGGNLPAEQPTYMYCPALQGKVGSTTILTTAGAATLTDNSPQTFWTN